MAEKKVKSPKSVIVPKSEPQSEKVSFRSWFDKQVKAGNLKFWQHKELAVFFREKGLSESENPDKYSEILKLY